MARCLAGEATADEQQTLQHILQQDSDLQQQYDLLKTMWSPQREESQNDEGEKENISRILELAIQHQHETTEERAPVLKMFSRPRTLVIALSSAAAILILLYLGWMFKPGNTPTASARVQPVQTLVTENGSKTRTILPDGTTVWLNAGSHISYNQNFLGATREVKLEGEAFFDVVKNAKHPFIVHVANYDIRVLGTEFNVKSYPQDKTVETTLIRGLVQVTKQGKEKQKPIYLHPNEKLIVEKIAANPPAALPVIRSRAEDNNQYIIKPLDSTIKETDRVETAWVYNRLKFDDDSFEELAGKLERWYNVTIIFDDDAVKKLHLHGSFENETIEQALTALEIATPFHYEMNGQVIHIKSAPKGK